MSKKKLNEEQIAKEAAKRFRMLCEYTFVTEEGDGEDAPMPDDNQMPQDGSDMNAAPEVPGGVPQEGNPAEMGGGMPQDNPEMGGNDAMMGAASEEGAPGFNPEEGAGEEPRRHRFSVPVQS